MFYEFVLHLVCFTMINGFTQFTAKCPYGKKSHGEVSLRRSVLTAKCPHGEVSVRRSVRTAKCPYGEVSVRRNVLRRNVLRRKVLRRKVRSRFILCFSKQMLGIDNNIYMLKKTLGFLHMKRLKPIKIGYIEGAWHHICRQVFFSYKQRKEFIERDAVRKLTWLSAQCQYL